MILGTRMVSSTVPAPKRTEPYEQEPTPFPKHEGTRTLC